MIEVKGPNVFSGYWRMPEKTAQEFRPDGHFVTGDLGQIDADGYIHIVGRAKDLVISGGFNVYPKEVETEIDAIDGVLESAVIGLPHPDFGEGVTAVIVRRAGATVTEEGRALGPRRTAGEIQGAEAGVLRRHAAAQQHGQGAEGLFCGRRTRTLSGKGAGPAGGGPSPAERGAQLPPAERNDAPQMKAVNDSADGNAAAALGRTYPERLKKPGARRFR